MLQKKNQRSTEMAALMGEVDASFKGFRKGFNPGEAVKCTVVSVGNEFLILNLNSKLEGIINRVDLNPEAPMPAVGDTLTLYFIAMQEGAARFTAKLSGSGAAVNQSIQSAYASKLPLEGVVEKEVNGGYEVTVGGQRAFCPYSQIDIMRTRDSAASYIGQRMTFLVSEYDPEEGAFVVSRRAVLELDREAQRMALIASLNEGDMREGTVTSIMPFGVFVDCGGFEGLIPNKELSWDRTLKAEDIVKVGQKVTVSVISIDWETDRFALSLRAVAKDPWDEFLEEYGVGQFLTAKVTKLMPFGAFAQLAPGVEGLIAISKLGNGRRIMHPREVLKEGETLDVQIEAVDAAQRRISLTPAASVAAEEAERKEAEDLANIVQEKNKAGKRALGSFGDLLDNLNL